MTSLAYKIYVEVGLKALIDSSADTKVLCLQRLVRLSAYGSSTLILTLFLQGLGYDAEKIGLFMTLTLLGDVVISLVLTVIADRIGRRRMLALGSLLMASSGVVFAIFSQFWILVLASVVGVISPSGGEIGPFKAIEESTISQLVSSHDRSNVLAWYMLSGTAGAAIGTIVCGWVVHALQVQHGWTAVEAYRIVFWAYAVLGVVKFVLSFALTSSCEVQKQKQKPVEVVTGEREPLLSSGSHDASLASHNQTPASPRSRMSLLPDLSAHTIGLLFKLGTLFAFDSLASGMASASWMVYFFHEKFSIQEGQLGNLFFVANIVLSASNLAAASLAKRIGLVKTMVLTHLPASVALIILPIPSNPIVAIALLIFRACTASMDQAPRQAFLAAAVLPEERTAVMGIVNVVKTLSQSGGPILTGAFVKARQFGIAFAVAGALKCAYDVLMLAMFIGYRTVEEKAEMQVEQEIQRERAEGTDQQLQVP